MSFKARRALRRYHKLGDEIADLEHALRESRIGYRSKPSDIRKLQRRLEERLAEEEALSRRLAGMGLPQGKREGS